MKISVVGTGYVGLVAGVCFADTGHQVTCVDRDLAKVQMLRDGRVPIYEPGLEDLMRPSVKAGRLVFTENLKDSVQKTDVVFIAVGTPDLPDGNADMGPTFAVVDAIAAAANGPKFVVLKSTVPVGTAAKVRARFESQCPYKIEVISNPEFLKEGAAIDDFLRPDRIIIGCRTEEAQQVMKELYAPFVKNGHPIFFMDNPSAELTKYAANSFLAIKISFINELANLADKVGADINAVRQGFTTDRRINPAFFYPGVGYGGSCFPKDVKALVQSGAQNDSPMRLVQAANEVNDLQKTLLISRMKSYFESKGESLKGKKIAIWGLSFKPRTDDVREAPALALIDQLSKHGATAVAYDPVAIETAKQASKIDFATTENAMDALRGADALAVLTEWNEFRSPDFAEVKARLKNPVIFDGRNVYDPKQMTDLGFSYFCIGRQSVKTTVNT
jgi:UDPglucose 6-dehydrogenase